MASAEAASSIVSVWRCVKASDRPSSRAVRGAGVLATVVDDQGGHDVGLGQTTRCAEALPLLKPSLVVETPSQPLDRQSSPGAANGDMSIWTVFVLTTFARPDPRFAGRQRGRPERVDVGRRPSCSSSRRLNARCAALATSPAAQRAAFIAHLHISSLLRMSRASRQCMCTDLARSVQPLTVPQAGGRPALP